MGPSMPPTTLLTLLDGPTAFMKCFTIILDGHRDAAMAFSMILKGPTAIIRCFTNYVKWACLPRKTLSMFSSAPTVSMRTFANHIGWRRRAAEKIVNVIEWVRVHRV